MRVRVIGSQLYNVCYAEDLQCGATGSNISQSWRVLWGFWLKTLAFEIQTFHLVGMLAQSPRIFSTHHSLHWALLTKFLGQARGVNYNITKYSFTPALC